MSDKIISFRLPEEYNEYLETIKKAMYPYTPSEKVRTTDLILSAIAYTGKILKDPE